MSAVSNKLTPASRQISTSRVASATFEEPQALKNWPSPPKVPAPKLRIGTLRPDPPSCLNSTSFILQLGQGAETETDNCCARLGSSGRLRSAFGLAGRAPAVM